jgi:phage protein D
MKPAFSISMGGLDITGRFNDRLLLLQLTEYDGHEADTLQITLDDRDFSIDAPPTEAELSVMLGYVETGLVFKGVFKVDEIEVQGPPYEMKIHAKSADQVSAQKQHRTKHYENKTLGSIVNEVAGRYGLTPGISAELASFQYDYVNQTEESDWHFLTRLSHNHDALFSIKNKHLMFMKRGDSQSMSGLAMPQILVNLPGNLIRYRALVRDRPRHKKSKASWHDYSKGEVTVEDDSGNDGEAEFNVRHLHLNQKIAKEVAKSKQKMLERAEGEVQCDIIGDPLVTAEGTMVVSTGRSILDDEWLIRNVVHNMTNDGYHTWIAGGANDGKSNKGSARPSKIKRF